MNVADLPPLWRDHYEESVAIGIESGGDPAFIKRDRLANTLRCIEAERVDSLLAGTLGAKRCE
jgi:hypothetical protein